MRTIVFSVMFLLAITVSTLNAQHTMPVATSTDELTSTNTPTLIVEPTLAGTPTSTPPCRPPCRPTPPPLPTIELDPCPEVHFDITDRGVGDLNGFTYTITPTLTSPVTPTTQLCLDGTLPENTITEFYTFTSWIMTYGIYGGNGTTGLVVDEAGTTDHCFTVPAMEVPIVNAEYCSINITYDAQKVLSPDEIKEPEIEWTDWQLLPLIQMP